MTAIAILKLSAIGDVVNTVPLVRAIQDARPDWSITWIVGRTEAKLVGDLPGVEFAVFDKQGGAAAVWELRRRLRGRRFDALLLLQRSLRAHLLSLLVSARERLGFDRARAREGHGLFVHRRLPPMRGRAHVLDSLLEFLAARHRAPEPAALGTFRSAKPTAPSPKRCCSASSRA